MKNVVRAFMCAAVMAGNSFAVDAAAAPAVEVAAVPAQPSRMRNALDSAFNSVKSFGDTTQKFVSSKYDSYVAPRVARACDAYKKFSQNNPKVVPSALVVTGVTLAAKGIQSATKALRRKNAGNAVLAVGQTALGAALTYAGVKTFGVSAVVPAAVVTPAAQ